MEEDKLFGTLRPTKDVVCGLRLARLVELAEVIGSSLTVAGPTAREKSSADERSLWEVSVVVDGRRIIGLARKFRPAIEVVIEKLESMLGDESRKLEGRRRALEAVGFVTRARDGGGGMSAPKHIVEACARAAHEVNRAYCLNDPSQVPWEDAPDWQRQSAINGVRGVLEDGNGPRESHASWLREKEATGWKFGPVKDAEKKEHPCFLTYDELPEAQRVKDDLFVSTVTAVASALGYDPFRDHGVKP